MAMEKHSESGGDSMPFFDGGDTGCGELLLDLLLFMKKHPSESVVQVRALDPGDAEKAGKALESLLAIADDLAANTSGEASRKSRVARQELLRINFQGPFKAQPTQTGGASG